MQVPRPNLQCVLGLWGVLKNVIPRFLGQIPVSWRRAIIGHPDSPSRIATIAHNFLNRFSPEESEVFNCRGALEGYRMCIDWRRFRSFVYGAWEPEVSRALTSAVRQGMTVFDIGAHIGYYTLLLAKCVGPNGRVFSFEPLPGNFDLLRKNVQLNNLTQVQTFNQAVFSRVGEITISVPDDQPNSGNGSVCLDEGVQQFRVNAVSLDAFCEEFLIRPDVLKMDVEGAEYEVLRGAKRVIAQFRPKLLIELHHFDGNLAAHPVPDLVSGWGYHIDWIERWQLTSYILATPGTPAVEYVLTPRAHTA
jgi:FkbM family methyltransferase